MTFDNEEPFDTYDDSREKNYNCGEYMYTYSKRFGLRCRFPGNWVGFTYGNYSRLTYNGRKKDTPISAYSISFRDKNNNRFCIDPTAKNGDGGSQ